MTPPRAQDRMRRVRLAVEPLVLVLAAVSAGVTALSLAVPNVAPGVEVLSARESQVRQFFDVAGEGNLPSWWSTLLLALAAAAHLAAAVMARRARDRAAPAWWVSAAVLLALSLDESTALHERLDEVGRALPGGADLTFAWVLPGAVLAAVMLLAFTRLARALPLLARRHLLLGTVLFLGGALVLETVNGAVLDAWGTGPAYVLLTHVEELAEMLGAVALLSAATRMLHRRRVGPDLVLRYAIP